MIEFGGFDYPEENWSKLPHALIEALPLIETLGELKCLLYILRHTWGYQEFGEHKRISLDEFQKGRKHGRRWIEAHPSGPDRLDHGTGMTREAIVKGLRYAEAHGFITTEVDDRDAARVRKSYCLSMGQGFGKPTPEVGKTDPSGSDLQPRSYKDTLDTNISIGGGELSDDQEKVFEALRGINIRVKQATQLAEVCTLDQVARCINYGRTSQGIENLAGFVVASLRAGEFASEPGDNGHKARRPGNCKDCGIYCYREDGGLCDCGRCKDCCKDSGCYCCEPDHARQALETA